MSLLTALLATVGCGDDKEDTASATMTAASNSNPTTDGTATDATGSTTMDEPTAGTTASPTTDEPTTTEDPTTGGACLEEMLAPGANAEGDACTANADCMSESCIKVTDGQTDAVCGPRAECSNTRIVGTLFDFDTKEPIAGAELRVVGALAALQDPGGAAGLVTATSDANGQVDATSELPINQGIGIIGLVGGGDYYITATGLASPYPNTSKYPPLNGIRDIWGVPTAKLTEWSGYLMADPDPEVATNLPLGDNGGVIGLVRSGGAGVANAVVTSAKDGSTALIRYLNDDGMGFNADATSANGVFVLMNPALAEGFTVAVDGTPTGLSGSAGSAKNAAFVLIFNVP